MSPSLPSWKILIGGIASLILTMGIARFALTPLLPAMQSATGLGNDGAGFLAAFNYAGYLFGALLSSRLHNPLHKQRYLRFGLLVSVLTTAAMAYTTSLPLWSILRFISGLGTTAGMVVSTSLVLDQLLRRKQSERIGIHFSGVGLGVIISGSLLSYGAQFLDWSQSWLFIASIGFVFAIPAFLWVNADGLAIPSNAHHNRVSLVQKNIFFLLISYGFAGATFSIGTTFLISIMADTPALSDSRNIAWILLGFALAPSSYIWIKTAAKLGDFRALCLALSIQALGCALPVLWPSSTSALLGGFLFGGTFMGIVSVVFALGGKLSPHNPAHLIGILVVSYGIGQIIGPIIAGIAMEITQISSLGLWSAAASSLLAIAFLFMTKSDKAALNIQNKP
jgi:predicted MFS family arabinose efflux permease